MDYVPFLIFLLYLYMYLLCDKKRFWTLNFFEIFEKSQLMSKFRKIRILDQIFEK